MSGQPPFLTVAEAHRRAKRRLPTPIYRALVAGTEQGLTLKDNLRAFTELGLRPKIFDRPMTRVQSTRVLGIDMPSPVILSPVGAQAIHPDGEMAVARAAATAGATMGLSSFASASIEAVVAANPNTFFQLYWLGDRDAITARMERARAAGAKGLILTLDWSFCYRRDWGMPTIPQRVDLATMIRSMPMAMARPAWAASFARTGRVPNLAVPNLATPSRPGLTFMEGLVEWAQTPFPTWSDIAWVRGMWTGPFVIKGVMDPEEARKAFDAGADAISVSNHGGNNVDGIPSPLRVLPSIVKAVGSQGTILVDGGIRRGSDVVKAIALGADAVLIGRAYLWGLAAAGEPGVRHVLEILRAGIDETLLALGRASLDELTPDDIVVPRDFLIDSRTATGPRKASTRRVPVAT